MGFGWTSAVILDLLARFPDIKVENNQATVDVAMSMFWSLVAALLY